MLDIYSYMVPARVKTLVVPSDSLPSEKFETFYNILMSKYFEVRLVDVTPHSGTFNPQGYPHGRVIYDFQLAPADSESIFLQDFEPFRKIFNVICITSYSDQNMDFEAQLAKLKESHSTSIQHIILVFDTPSDILNTLSKQNNVFYVSDASGVSLETTICDITSKLLEALSTYASSYQHVTLRSPGSVGSTELTMSSPASKNGYNANGNNNGHSSYSSTQSNGSKLTASTSSSNAATNVAAEKKKKRISSAAFLSSFDSSPNNNGLERMKAAKIKGRQQKVMGNFYLLSGRLNDALKEFCASIASLKAGNDHLWLASALDGLGVCIMMLTFLEVPFQLPTSITSIINPSITSSTKETPALFSPASSPRNSVSSVSRNSTNSYSSSTMNAQGNTANSTAPEFDLFNTTELVSKIANKSMTYYKATFDSIEDCVPQIVYCESILRFLKLASIIYVNNGLDFKVLRHVIRGEPLHVADDSPSSDIKAPFNLDRSQIVAVERDIFSPPFAKLDFLHKTRILSCLISVSTDLQLLRRRSFLLNQLFDLISEFASSRELEINSSISAVAKQGKISIDYKTNSAALTKLIDDTLMSYGVILDTKSADRRALSPNWVDLHLVVLEKFIHLTEKLGLTAASMKYASILLKSYVFALGPAKQLEIFDRICSQARRLALEDEPCPLSYWDDFLVKEISSVPAISDLTPIRQNKAAADAPAKSEVYNPFASEKSIKEELVTLVQGEAADLILTLQNPFAFDIDLKQLVLVSKDGFELKTLHYFLVPVPQQQAQDAQPDFITVKPYQVVDVVVSFIPLQAGALEISAIKAQVGDCEVKEFEICTSRGYTIHEKIKSHGVNGFLQLTEPSILFQTNLDNTESKTLKYHVLPPQPVLSLTGTSLLNRSIMLLEGETKIFTLSLQNNSATAINSLTSVFLDSTAEPLRKALGSKLPPNEIYEIEYYLLKKLPFKIIDKHLLGVIDPYAEFSIQISLLGKRGMTSGSIMFEYGNNSEDVQLDYIRRIDIPISITVYPSIEIASCDIIPLFNSDEIFESNQHLLKMENKGSFWSFLNKRVTANGEQLTDYCLLLLDLRNAWNVDLKVMLESSEQTIASEEPSVLTNNEYVESCEITDTICKSKTERFLLPIRRIRLSESALKRNIPSLRNKQYVVDNTTPKEEQDFVREAFWYRQELLKHIRGTWQVADETSSGDIELRGLRLSSKMMSILKVDTVEIDQAILKSDGTKVMKTDSLSYDLDLHEFYTIRTSITNKSTAHVRGLLRHIPMSKSTTVSIDRKLLYNGLLQYHVTDKLAPEESFQFDICVCALERGEFEWGTVFDEVVADGDGNLEEIESHSQRGPLYIVAR